MGSVRSVVVKAFIRTEGFNKTTSAPSPIRIIILMIKILFLTLFFLTGVTAVATGLKNSSPSIKEGEKV